MKVYAIGDLHLGNLVDKPMEIFGDNWNNHWEKIKQDWNKKVSQDDVVIICGDISWAMKLSEAESDIEEIKSLVGIKIIIRGNHDYWWQSLSRVRNILGNNMFALQNDSIKIGNCIFCGTRGWSVPESIFENEDDKKIYDREVLRLEMALKNASEKRCENDRLIAIVHYPPFNSKLEDNEFTSLLETYKVDNVIYGHLHGKNAIKNNVKTKNNIKYHLTSCDLVDFKLQEII